MGLFSSISHAAGGLVHGATHAATHNPFTNTIGKGVRFIGKPVTGAVNAGAGVVNRVGGNALSLTDSVAGIGKGLANVANSNPLLLVGAGLAVLYIMQRK